MLPDGLCCGVTPSAHQPQTFVFSTERRKHSACSELCLASLSGEAVYSVSPPQPGHIHFVALRKGLDDKKKKSCVLQDSVRGLSKNRNQKSGKEGTSASGFGEMLVWRA